MGYDIRGLDMGLGKTRRFYFLLFCLIGFGLAMGTEIIEGATPPTGGGKTPPPAPPTQGPLPATPAPVFPKFPTIGNQNGGNNGGGGEPPPRVFVASPPPKPYVPPEIKPLFQPKKPVIVKKAVRNRLYYASFERQYRSGVFAPRTAVAAAFAQEKSDVPSAMTLSLETLLRESKNDVLSSKHEYESDLIKIEENKLLHQAVDTLHTNKVISEQQYQESLSNLIKSQAKADESRYRVAEYKNEVAINEMKLAASKGDPISLVDLAKHYVDLWQNRVGKIKAAEGQAKAEYDYLLIAYKMAVALVSKGAMSKEELIRAKAAFDEADVVLRLARELLELNTKFADDARDSLKRLEGGNPLVSPGVTPS